MAKTVVLYPSVGLGHLVPMVQLGRLFLRRGFAVAIAVIKPPIHLPASDEAVARLAAANPSITFHTLPAVTVTEEGHFRRMLETVRLTTPHLADYLRSVAAAAVVFDMFCIDALDAASEVGIPGYMYFTSAASVLAVFLKYSQCMIDNGNVAEDLVIPGLPAIRPTDMTLPVDAELRKARIKAITRAAEEAKGCLVNSFDWLEARALRAFKEGAVLTISPRVYCVGPLIDAGKDAGSEGSKRDDCLAWLDEQPERSVVFLCFGSMGSFSAPQIKEIAVGLEKSGQRFLWVVRNPSTDGSNRSMNPAPPDLDALLPEGFLERTKDVGVVVKSWAPQAAVLQHKATGAFVTHCGWNSTLEAVTTGLPMVCWPLYAEQKLTKVFIVEDMRLGVEMAGYDADIVTAEEIATKVRWVMESEEARDLRRRAAEAKEQAAAALKDGGSSDAAFAAVIRDSGVL